MTNHEQRMALVQANEDAIRELAEQAASQTRRRRDEIVVWVATPDSALGQIIARYGMQAPPPKSVAGRPIEALLYAMPVDLASDVLAGEWPTVASALQELPVELGQIRLLVAGHGGADVVSAAFGPSPKRGQA